ncbi:MAG: hypothetical protein GF349_03995 [Candidatus Magasanikbacteria bacterium]|nr:hypothetical protein [Candidatus Magasanikbacteria bacterium]
MLLCYNCFRLLFLPEKCIGGADETQETEEADSKEWQ